MLKYVLVEVSEISSTTLTDNFLVSDTFIAFFSVSSRLKISFLSNRWTGFCFLRFLYGSFNIAQCSFWLCPSLCFFR